MAPYFVESAPWAIVTEMDTTNWTATRDGVLLGKNQQRREVRCLNSHLSHEALAEWLGSRFLPCRSGSDSLASHSCKNLGCRTGTRLQGRVKNQRISLRHRERVPATTAKCTLSGVGPLAANICPSTRTVQRTRQIYDIL